MEENTVAVDIQQLNEKIEKESSIIELLSMEVAKRVVGQKHMVESLLIGLLGNGHILLEGVPGLAKTLAIKVVILHCLNYTSFDTQSQLSDGFKDFANVILAQKLLT